VLRSALTTILVLGILFGASPTFAQTSATARSEADRQIAFARAEIAESHFERALTSAESALRLCPECREATLLKALAYDGLGDRKIAVRLIESYKQAAPESAQAKADRILKWFADTPRTRPPGRTLASGFVANSAAAPDSSLDPAPYRDRLTAALAAKRCDDATVAAEEWTRVRPDDLDAHRLAGDAAICAEDVRMAARLLNRWSSLKVDAPEARGHLETLAATAGSVTVTASPTGWTWYLDARGEWIAPSQGLTFQALPPDVDLVLVGLAPGLGEPTRVPVAPLRPGEARTVTAPQSGP
jgi:tetratricopeptide (TPR) repeat protein